MNIYILNQNSLIYSVYIDCKTVVLSSTDRDAMRGFKKTVEKHHRKEGKWLNACESYTCTTRNHHPEHALTLRESTTAYAKLLSDKWDLVEMDLYNGDDSRLVDFMYECSNVRFFLMKDYGLEDDALTLNGVLLSKPSETNLYTNVGYLNALRDNL